MKKYKVIIKDYLNKELYTSSVYLDLKIAENDYIEKIKTLNNIIPYDATAQLMEYEKLTKGKICVTILKEEIIKGKK